MRGKGLRLYLEHMRVQKIRQFFEQADGVVDSFVRQVLLKLHHVQMIINLLEIHLVTIQS
jgi:hypothetical protein